MASLPTITILPNLMILIGLFYIAVINGNVNNGDGRLTEFVSRSDQREFDYFVLSYLWPGSHCQNTRHCCSNNACCRGLNSPTIFTIHGLWANYWDGTWPACCTNSHFNIKEIATLRDDLEKYWPSYSCDLMPNCHGTKDIFWAHEWEKHGTCSSPVVWDEFSYFHTTLGLYFKYNVTEVLKEAGYIPSNSEKYPVGGIVSAIQNAFYTTPQLVCTDEGAIEELRMCFTKDFKFRECVNGSASNGRVSSTIYCPNYVSLPEYIALEHNGVDILDSSSPLDAAY